MADMQHRVLGRSCFDEYMPYPNAMAHIANTAVSDQYLVPHLIRYTSMGRGPQALTTPHPKARV